MTIPATIADLVRLEGEIDEALLNLHDKPAGLSKMADLKRRKDRLHDQIEDLMHEIDAADPH
ncbi:MAG TPA: DUF465 domain-containing protein [Pseudolabrys sp.]|nr:DUF465 domain-containing protein [Pseudolabrys sp.]